MYKEKFGFSEEPFKPSPDPKFFFGSKTHNKAMAYLHYGLRQGEGFIVITGAVGAGKSMLISHLLDQVDSTKIVVADLITPNLQPNDLLAHILSAFRVEATQEGAGAEIEAFKEFLLDQMNRGRRAVLIVDEAQLLRQAALELRVDLRLAQGLDIRAELLRASGQQAVLGVQSCDALVDATDVFLLLENRLERCGHLRIGRVALEVEGKDLGYGPIIEPHGALRATRLHDGPIGLLPGRHREFGIVDVALINDFSVVSQIVAIDLRDPQIEIGVFVFVVVLHHQLDSRVK